MKKQLKTICVIAALMAAGSIGNKISQKHYGD